ncbi:Sialidase [Hypoxylon argillaceum]|nr:Sialidase [Hypoxylon argillaceum]KAI1151681.1 Sialidase [Nemania diffusa]
MGYSDYDKGAVPMDELPLPCDQRQRRKSYVFRGLAVLTGAVLVTYALSLLFLPTSFLQALGCGKNRTSLSSNMDAGTIKVPPSLRLRGLPSIREVDMTRSNSTREGQPVIAVNPQNPNNLVFVSTRFYPLPELEPVGGCFLAYSFDRGYTWTNVTADYPLGNATKCGEPQVFADHKGTFYVLNNQVGSGLEANMAAHPQLSKSTDGGKTWSAPSETAMYIQGATKLRVDQVTGKVYANGASSWEYPAAVSVTSDGGGTWSSIYTIPGPMNYCLDYQIPSVPPVCGFPGRSIAVHDGILASAAEGLEGHPEMYVSRNDGATWTTLPLTDSHGKLVLNGTGPMIPESGIGLPSDPTPWVSADPTKTGRFALMVPREFTLEIYVTEDAGKHFTGPAVIQTPNAQRPAVDFGSTGVLGVMWRTNSSNILDAYSTVSFDSGRTFATPLKVTKRSQPVGQNGQPGDRASFIALTDKFAYVAWSDGRDGLLDAIFAEVPLELYHFPAK